MESSRIYTINKLGLEDLLWGISTKVQTRNNVSVSITEINASNIPFDATRTFAQAFEDAKVASVRAVEVPYYTPASGYYDSVLNEFVISIPRGTPGDNGENGLSPSYSFSYDEVTGELSYELVGYTPESESVIEEIL